MGPPSDWSSISVLWKAILTMAAAGSSRASGRIIRLTNGEMVTFGGDRLPLASGNCHSLIVEFAQK